ncbi:CDK-activating kinase assembly factor MAT1 [Tetrabaena socialis]|uniref:CDK-activating kinase assembly factor MAT1 n=1 Tax=Tetrabaena socialis TaxID=47790 RepID=A0A2J8A816_9CHLO|nr:CDK-activating kinase assembly factor MAT1 [Tetrabaena socialis]|eukprot:PNH08679.1 CDK-activating kinase assembly factor MAT1 [Tetrabaena socialis]
MEMDLEKELKVRKRIRAIYNKDREDFGSKNEYDDYLEEVEDIIWRLSTNVELDRTEAQVRKYRQQNQEQINAKSARQANLDAHLDASQLAAASMAGTQAPKAAPPPSSGGVPNILPKLAQDYSALLEASRDIKYDNRLLGKSGPEAAAAGGWSVGVWQARFAQEAFSSLLLPPVH